MTPPPSTAAGRALLTRIINETGLYPHPDTADAIEAAILAIESESQALIDTDDAYKRGYHDGTEAAPPDALREALLNIVRQVDNDTLHPTTIAPSFLAEARAALTASPSAGSGQWVPWGQFAARWIEPASPSAAPLDPAVITRVASWLHKNAATRRIITCGPDSRGCRQAHRQDANDILAAAYAQEPSP